MKKLNTKQRITVKLTVVLYVIAVVSVLMVVNACKKNSTSSTVLTGGRSVTTDLNVVSIARMRDNGNGSTTVLFYQREQPFIVNNASDLSALQAAYKAGNPVRINADVATGMLKQVSTLSSDEIKAYNAAKPAVISSEGATHTVTAAKLADPSFDDVESLGISSDLSGCTNMVPDMATLQLMFTYMAHQCCALPGPYEIDYCIPFQYVIDGCYARAHKMCWIMNNRYNYCTRKVYSFAIDGSDVLGVKANKWGGCCVEWWYHVAPLVCVRTPTGPKAYVIDPGMFDNPVPLSQWLSAQENKGCTSNANVSMYTIQPTSAYCPADGTGTSFYTDPDFSSTDATLEGYASLHTCY